MGCFNGGEIGPVPVFTLTKSFRANFNRGAVLRLY